MGSCQNKGGVTIKTHNYDKSANEANSKYSQSIIDNIDPKFNDMPEWPCN